MVYTTQVLTCGVNLLSIMAKNSHDQREVDVALAVLAHPRRRYILHALQDYKNPMALADLATEVARQENGASTTEMSSDEIKCISRSLYHIHIPKLVDDEIVHHDREQNFVSLAECSDQLDLYQDLLSLE